mmetsp:Transcript_9101/g.23273  ORF Transcript_9101/g.23273 Transcript_9101/m.23273 type:complete len:266 (+) Transcript_9101:271-1068(+)|eukprot:jgi/Tetstr1/432765/TSEL_002327.t1
MVLDVPPSPTPSTFSHRSYASSVPPSPAAQRMLQAYRAKHMIVALVDKLRSAKPEDRMAGASQIEKLANDGEEIQGLFRDAGAVPLLVAMLQRGLSEAEVGLRAIINMVCNNHECKEAVRGAGGVPHLVTLTNVPPDHGITRWAVWAVGALASNNPENQDAVRRHGGIKPLVRLLSPSTPSDVASEAAISLLTLSFNWPANQDAVRAEGGVAALVGLLGEGNADETTLQAVLALNALVGDNIPIKEEIRDVGGLPHLVRLLKVRV